MAIHGGLCHFMPQSMEISSAGDAMRSLNISLPESMRSFIEDQTRRGGYGTASEYLRTLIRDAWKRQAEDRLEGILLEGLDSGKPTDVSPDYWERKKRPAVTPRRTKRS